MKLELERQNFLKAWQIAERFANTKTTKDSISGILITASEDNQVILEATDLKTSVRCKAEGVNVIEAGFGVVPVMIVGSMLKKLSAENLVIEVNSERGFLNAGSNKTRFAVISADEFPKIPESNSADDICDIMGSDLGKLIAEGSSSASAPSDFPKYLGTCLLRTGENSLKGVSTDGKRLSLSSVLCTANKTEDLLLPAPALKELGKMVAMNYSDEIVKILADGSTAWFKLENVEFSIRRIEASFPNYERILNSETMTTLKVSCIDLSSALERIDIIARTTPAHIMAMTLTPDGELKITARAPEMGTASEVLDSNIVNIEGSYIQLGFNVGYFQEGLKALGSGDIVIEFSGEEGQTRMLRNGENDFLYMLMPARLSVQDKISDDISGDVDISSGEMEDFSAQSDSENAENNENSEA